MRYYELFEDPTQPPKPPKLPNELTPKQWSARQERNRKKRAEVETLRTSIKSKQDKISTLSASMNETADPDRAHCSIFDQQ